ncbi:uncharacterized protein LOC112570549 [Pomacea canaliculata]|uniref:uncharacterized protein LOC112570549 n=1 Tax=Pomacea canaliculata TaxID=400727 RepID=UPI000D735661|nr:uncharacterized protein LOC112570549 [Pomacea canaliculata]XP_025104844.1 uncharacterized protein LOC112570549 [Pomacea canaliculata]XP_025104845.1 uncharacterized protein LOC112570549 [Pomacea canaliculata]
MTSEGEEGSEEAAANRVIPPRPKEMGQRPQRGDIDIVIISQKYGVVLVEVKAAGVSGSSWAHNEAASRDAYRSVLLKAAKQLNRASHVFRFITPDLIPPPDITLVIAVPFMSRRQLHQILLEGKGEFCDSFHYLCKGDLKNRKWVTGLFTKHEACRQQRETVGHDWCSSDAGAGTEGLGCSLCRWWDENITECTCLPLHQVKSIVGRICGLMSIVSVWTQTTPRVEVRTTGQAVSEVGRRVADIVLLPEQAALLADTSCNRVCLTGPMGSGKTLLLQLKGRQWLAEGRRVVILNVRTSGRGRAVGYALEEAIVRQDGESASTGTVERHDLAIAETSLEQLAARLQVSGSVEDICFILDELTKQTFDFVLQLAGRYPDCPVWCVAMFLHSPLQGFRHFRLGDVLRSPPSVQLLLRQLDLNPYHHKAYTTRSAARGLPCDGPPIILIQHRLHDPSTRPLHCHQCAIELADICSTRWAWPRGQ